MKQLLKINSSPAVLEYKTQNANLIQKSNQISYNMTRDKGGLTIKSTNSKVIMDSFESRDSVRPSTSTIIRQFALEGFRAAYEATSRYASEGDNLLTLHLDNDPIISNVMQRLEKPYEFRLMYIPTQKVDISFTQPQLSISYEMDKLRFNWNTDRTPAEFNSGSIEFNMKSYGDIQIEYLGEPHYIGENSI